MKPLSLDLRERVINAFENGMSRKEIIRVFQIGSSTLYLWIRLKKRKGNLNHEKSGGSIPIISVDQYPYLQKLLREHPNVTLEELCDMWAQEPGMIIDSTTMSRTIRRMGWSYKKKRLTPQNEMKKKE